MLLQDIRRQETDGTRTVAGKARLRGTERGVLPAPLGLLFLRHHLSSRELDAECWQQELRTEDFVVCRTKFRGGRFDEVPNLPAGNRRSWSKIRVVLGGRIFATTRSGGVVMEPGDLVVSRGWDDHRCRSLEDASEYLLVAWKHGNAGERPNDGGPLHLRGVDAVLGPSARALDLATAMNGRSPAAIEHAARVLVRSMVDFGLPLARDVTQESSERIVSADRRFSRVIEATLFELASRPMAIDLGNVLGVTERHALRLANDFLRRYYVTAIGWREAVRGLRLELGVFFATNPRATTERVSRAVGFSSPTALCHAFHHAGLPSPNAVRRRLLQEA